MEYEKQLQHIKNGSGFIAALDQSGGSTPKALENYGVSGDAYDNDEAPRRRCSTSSTRCAPVS